MEQGLKIINGSYVESEKLIIDIASRQIESTLGQIVGPEQLQQMSNKIKEATAQILDKANLRGKKLDEL